jgi:predicted secreted Zn-dependent protease
MLHARCAALLALAAGTFLAGSAGATVQVKAKTTGYSIKGATGEALLDAMDRKGPKRGLMTHAIAQTGYTVGWTIDWRKNAGGCRVATADASLNITYNYPEVSSPMSADLSRRWEHFMAGVRKHEQTHGRIAKEMVDVAEQAVSAVSFAEDRSCIRTQAEVKRRIAKTYAKYEARQIEFDRVEHAEGGNVEGLVSLLSHAHK